MRYLEVGTLLLVFTMLVALTGPNAKADEKNWETYMTFSQPVEIPGMVLLAGRYEFRLVDPGYTNRQVVGIFNSRGQMVDNVIAVPDYRTNPTDETVVSLEKTRPGAPEAVKAWFYPGSDFGLEFVYPKAKIAKTPATK